MALLLYAYCEGEHSSRRIERRCREDIAFHVLSANQQPDHATICRFRQRREQALAGLFVEVLRICAEAGLAPSGLVSMARHPLPAPAVAVVAACPRRSRLRARLRHGIR